MRRIKRIVIPVLSVSALVLIVPAFTNQLTFNPSANNFGTVGYGALTVQGANVANIHYVVDAQGQNISEEDLTFTGTLPAGENVAAAWNNDGGTTATTACTPASTTVPFSTAVCTLPIAIASALNFDVSVTPGT